MLSGEKATLPGLLSVLQRKIRDSTLVRIIGEGFEASEIDQIYASARGAAVYTVNKRSDHVQ